MSGRLGQSGNQHSAEIKRTADSEVATIQSISLESSFPPVAWLRECNELHPGFAKRYLDDLIDERQAITAVEIEHVRHSHTIQSRGQIYGLVIGLAGICASFAISYFAKDPVTASIVGGTTVVSLVVVFITGHWAKPKTDQSDDKQSSKPAPKNLGKNS